MTKKKRINVKGITQLEEREMLEPKGVSCGVIIEDYDIYCSSFNYTESQVRTEIIVDRLIY